MFSAQIEMREKLRMRLEDENEVELAEVLFRCAEPMEMISQCCGETREIERGCKKRWCPVCAPKITQSRLDKYEFGAQMMKWPLAITLTCKNKIQAEGAIRSLRKALSRFRRTKFFGTNVRGGLCSIEVTNTGNGWHVHAHLLVDCRWLALATPEPRRGMSRVRIQHLLRNAHEELSREWAKQVEQEEAVVWAERAYGKALLETVKYAVKVQDLLAAKEPIGCIIREMHRLQLVNGFGTMYGLGKKFAAELEEAKPVCMCGRCGKESEWLPSDVYQTKMFGSKGKRIEKMRKRAHFNPVMFTVDGIPY